MTTSRTALLIGFCCLVLTCAATVMFASTSIARSPLSLTPSPEPATSTLVPTATATPAPTAMNTTVPVPTDTPALTATNTNTAVPVSTDTPAPTTANTTVPVVTVIPALTATNTTVPVPTDTPAPTTANTTVPVATDTPRPSDVPATAITTTLPTVLPTASPQPTSQATVSRSADPRLEKVVDTQEAQRGDRVRYLVRVTNEGDVAATDVVVSDPLPTGLTLMQATASRGQVIIDGTTVTVILGSVTPNEVITIEITASITAATGRAMINRATLTTTSTTDNPRNNSGSVEVMVTTSVPSATPRPASLVRQKMPTTAISEGLTLPIGVVVGVGLMVFLFASITWLIVVRRSRVHS